MSDEQMLGALLPSDCPSPSSSSLRRPPADVPTSAMDSLMPKSDSFNARVRGASHIDFKTATTGVAAKAMRNELSALVNTVKDPDTRKVRIFRLLPPSYNRSLKSLPIQVLRH